MAPTPVPLSAGECCRRVPVATSSRSPAVPRTSSSAVPAGPVDVGRDQPDGLEALRPAVPGCYPPHVLEGRQRPGPAASGAGPRPSRPRDVLAVDDDVEQRVLGFAERREPRSRTRPFGAAAPTSRGRFTTPPPAPAPCRRSCGRSCHGRGRHRSTIARSVSSCAQVGEDRRAPTTPGSANGAGPVRAGASCSRRAAQLEPLVPLSLALATRSDPQAAPHERRHDG